MGGQPCKTCTATDQQENLKKISRLGNCCNFIIIIFLIAYLFKETDRPLEANHSIITSLGSSHFPPQVGINPKALGLDSPLSALGSGKRLVPIDSSHLQYEEKSGWQL